MTEELKECPFCGGEAEVNKNYVKCKSCFARTDKYVSSKYAILGWNQRYPITN